MTLARVVAEAFAARAEEVAAKEGQRLGQLGVFLLQLAVVSRSRFEHALELIDAALSACGLLLSACGLLLSACGLLLSVCGLLPQLVVAAEQVVEQPHALLRIVGETWWDAHNMNYGLLFILCKSIGADFSLFFRDFSRRTGTACVGVRSAGRSRRGSWRAAPVGVRRRRLRRCWASRRIRSRVACTR